MKKSMKEGNHDFLYVGGLGWILERVHGLVGWEMG